MAKASTLCDDFDSATRMDTQIIAAGADDIKSTMEGASQIGRINTKVASREMSINHPDHEPEAPTSVSEQAPFMPPSFLASLGPQSLPQGFQTCRSLLRL